jgi:hypothetical protein
VVKEVITPATKNNQIKINYNNISKKAKVMISQPELQKCMTHQPFEVNYQLEKKKKLSLEEMIAEAVTTALIPVINRLVKLDDLLHKVINLNNLKTS